jgi:hypothetical protein
MMPRLEEDSATGAGRIAPRRLDADDRVRVSTVRSILTSAPRDRIGGGTPPQAAAFERAGDTRTPAKRLVVCRACSTAWGCKSPTQPDGGEVLAKRKGVAARRRLKEAWSKTATRRTETGYQAVQVGRADNLPRSPHPSRAWGVDPAGVRRRRSNLPREVCAGSR